MAEIFKQVLEHLGVRQLRSSAYHPESQGVLEQYHQTLKTMLRAYCQDYPEDWDKGIPFVLLTTRDIPSESTRYSPFKLVYGHEVRGSLKFGKERLLGESKPCSSNFLDYVSGFRERLSHACEVAREHLRVPQECIKAHFDQKAKTRIFKPGDSVLVLLPTSQ